MGKRRKRHPLTQAILIVFLLLRTFGPVVCAPSGRERTAVEYAELFARAGLRLTRIVPTKSPYSVIEAIAAE